MKGSVGTASHNDMCEILAQIKANMARNHLVPSASDQGILGGCAGILASGRHLKPKTATKLQEILRRSQHLSETVGRRTSPCPSRHPAPQA